MEGVVTSTETEGTGTVAPAATSALTPIVVDTREARPYLFDSSTASVTRGALPAGDYSLRGFETRIAIERKSLDDFVNTVIHARERFRAELDVLATYDFAAIVVEANVEDLLAGRFTSRANPASLFAIACAIVADRRIPVFWLSDRQTAQAAVQQILGRLYRAAVAATAAAVVVEGEVTTNEAATEAA